MTNSKKIEILKGEVKRFQDRLSCFEDTKELPDCDEALEIEYKIIQRYASDLKRELNEFIKD